MFLFEFKDFSLFSKEKFFLQDVSLKISQSESVAVIGESGCGKSLLLKCIAGLGGVFFSFDFKGDVFLEEQRVGINLEDRIESRGKTLMLFQDFSRQFDSRMSVYDHFKEMFYSDFEDKKNFNKYVSSVLIEMKLPSDKSFLNRRLYYLSGGEKQRLLFAFGLLKNPRLLLLDEIFSSLDEDNKIKSLHLIKEYKRKTNSSFVVVSHDMNVIKNLCDRIYLLKEGRVVEEALTLDFFSCPKTEYGKEFLQFSL